VTLPEILGFEDGRHCSTSWTPNPTKKTTCLLPKPPRKAVLPYQKLPSQSPHFEAPMMKSMWQTPPLLSFHGSDQNPLHLGTGPSRVAIVLQGWIYQWLVVFLS